MCCYLNVHIFLPSMPGSCNGSIPLAFPHKNLYASLLCPVRTTFTGHLILLYMFIRILFGEYKTWTLYGHLRCPVITSPLGSHIFPQHPTLEHTQTIFFPECDRPSLTPIQNQQTNL